MLDYDFDLRIGRTICPTNDLNRPVCSSGKVVGEDQSRKFVVAVNPGSRARHPVSRSYDPHSAISNLVPPEQSVSLSRL